MNLSHLSRVVISLVIIAAGVGGFVALGTPEVETRPPDQRGAPVVKTATAEEHQDGIQFDVDGVVVPFRQIDIAAQVAGRVEFKSDVCDTGRAVKKGDLLVRIEPSDYQLEVTRLTEELNQADAMLNELDVEMSTTDNQIELSKQQLEIDERELKRQQELVAKRAASETEVDGARRAELATRNTLQTLQDQRSLLSRRHVRLESAKALVQANLDKAELALQRTEIRAPLDGVIVSENVEQDGFVQMGSPVISLQDTSQLDVSCKLHIRQMHWLWQGATGGDTGSLSQAYDFPETPATVIYRIGGTSYQWDGVVNRYDGAGIDDQTRMVPCRVNVGDPLSVAVSEGASESSNPPTLMTGMFVKVRVHARPPIPLVRVPQEAIQPGNKIWVVDDDDSLRQKDALIANSGSTFVVAYQQKGGLQAGDSVVISPLASPIEGLKVHDLAKGPPPRAGGFGGRGGPPGAGGGGPPGAGGRPGTGRPGTGGGGPPKTTAGAGPRGGGNRPGAARNQTSGPKSEET